MTRTITSSKKGNMNFNESVKSFLNSMYLFTMACQQRQLLAIVLKKFYEKTLFQNLGENTPDGLLFLAKFQAVGLL